MDEGKELHRFEQAAPRPLNRTAARVAVAIGLLAAAGGGVALAMGAKGAGIGGLAGGGVIALIFLQVALGDGRARVPGIVIIKEQVLVLAFTDRTETIPWSEVKGVGMARFAGKPASCSIRTQRGTWTIPMGSVQPTTADQLEMELKLRLPS